MYCPKCGLANDDNAFRCVRCGTVVQVLGSVAPMAEDRTMIRVLLPVDRSALSIAAGYAGLFAVLAFPAPLALLLGILAIVDLKKHPGKLGMGRAVFGVVMGALGTSLLAFFFLNR